MTSDIVASALAGLGPMMMQSQRKPVDKYGARRQFGDALLMQGAQATPLRGGVAEGLARAGQAVLGGWMANKADTEQTAEDEAQSKALMDAIGASQRTGPDGQPTFDLSPVTAALVKTNPGMAAYLQTISLLQKQQAQGRLATAASLFGPDGTAPAGGGGAPTGGVPGNYPDRIQATESPNGATNPQSGASGFYQFMPKTAHGLAQQTAWGRGLSVDQVMQVIREEAAVGRKDKQQELLALYNRASDTALQQAGIPANDVTRFALHAFGPAGGVSLLRAPDNMPVADWVRSVNWDGASPEQVIAQNNLGKYQTVGQVKQDFIARRIAGSQAPSVAPQAGQPPRPVQMAQAGGMPDVTSTQFGQAPIAGMPQPMPQLMPQPGQGAPPVARPVASSEPPPPPNVPRPQLPAEYAARLRQQVASGALTAAQAQSEALRITDGLWAAQREQANREHATALEKWKFDREAGTTRNMTPDELKQAGLPAGAVAQIGRDGTIKVISKPDDPMKDIDGLRKEIRALPAVKAFEKVTPLFASMVNSSKVNGRAADLDLIYGLATILDPDSVVRESDSIQVRRTGGLTDEVIGYISAVNGGAALTPDVRAGIMQIAASRVGEYRNAVDAAVSPYKGLAQRRNWNWDDIAPGVLPMAPYSPQDIGVDRRPTGGPPKPATPAPVSKSGHPVMRSIEEARQKLNPGDLFEDETGAVRRLMPLNPPQRSVTVPMPQGGR